MWQIWLSITQWLSRVVGDTCHAHLYINIHRGRPTVFCPLFNYSSHHRFHIDKTISNKNHINFRFCCHFWRCCHRCQSRSLRIQWNTIQCGLMREKNMPRRTTKVGTTFNALQQYHQSTLQVEHCQNDSWIWLIVMKTSGQNVRLLYENVMHAKMASHLLFRQCIWVCVCVYVWGEYMRVLYVSL